jgi:hypothetical protein
MPAESALRHIRYLTQTIGPRGTMTEGERRAAAYAHQVMCSLGLHDVRRESFIAPSSMWLPYAVSNVVALLGGLVGLSGGRAGVAVGGLLSLLAAYWFFAEPSFRDTLLHHILPRGQSQNVVGVIPTRGITHQRVVLVGHLDTQRTPWFFASPPALTLFLGSAYISFGGMVLQGLLLAARPLIGISLLPALTWILLLWFALGAVSCLQADRTPFTEGANDNASAVGVLLDLAEQLVARPLEHTEVWVLCSGSEEVGCHGMVDFLRTHGGELRDAIFLAIEAVGIGQVRYSVREGILWPYPTPRQLIRLAEKVAARRPDLDPHPVLLHGGYTETGAVIAAGLRGMTLLCLCPDGSLPYWHQQADTFDKLDAAALERAGDVLWELLADLDGSQPATLRPCPPGGPHQQGPRYQATACHC